MEPHAKTPPPPVLFHGVTAAKALEEKYKDTHQCPSIPFPSFLLPSLPCLPLPLFPFILAPLLSEVGPLYFS